MTGLRPVKREVHVELNIDRPWTMSVLQTATVSKTSFEFIQTLNAAVRGRPPEIAPGVMEAFCLAAAWTPAPQLISIVDAMTNA